MSNQTRLAFAILSAVAAANTQASAYGHYVQFDVVASHYSQPISSFMHAGQSYVAGKSQQEFRVRLRNVSGERVLAVLSIDGVNAVSGQTAGFDQPGYVLAPYQTLEVDGWRKSNHRAAAFYFTHIADSYAARTGRADNVGVIGVAVFREQRHFGYGYRDDVPVAGEPWGDRNRYKSQESAAPEASDRSEAKRAPSASAGAPLGTGHGSERYSYARRVEFQREHSPAEVLTVRYDSMRNLLAMGVVPRHHRGYHAAPEAFPRSADYGYVPDPPGYGYQHR
jgi:hypothetical protein